MLTSAPIGLIAFGIFGAIVFWLRSQFDKELKRSAPSVFEDLYAKKAWGVKWNIFLLRRGYSKLGNRRLTLFGDIILAFALAGVALLIAWPFIPHEMPPPGSFPPGSFG